MKIVGIILIALVIFAIRMGLRMAFRAGTDAVFGNGNQQLTPSCPHCSSANVTQAGGHWDCGTCGQMF